MFNSRILLSAASIAAAGALIIGATFAFFSDTETSSGNILTAGTIDITVDGENPWTETYSEELTDMKPSQVRWIEFPIRNVGSNPAVVWKHIGNVVNDEGVLTEPECDAYGGEWIGSECSGGTVKNNIDKVITYDMEVDGTVLIDEDWGVTIRDIKSLWVPLGRIEPGEDILVRQSYHIQATAGNEYQGDKMTFDIDLYAEQLLGAGPGPTTHGLVLENKTASWDPIIDGRWGLLTWDGTGAFDFSGHGLTAGTSYTLIYYPEPQTTWPWPVTPLDTDTAAGDGTISLSGSLPASLSGIKIWLVESTDIVGGSMSGWDPSKYLFESNLINTP